MELKWLLPPVLRSHQGRGKGCIKKGLENTEGLEQLSGRCWKQLWLSAQPRLTEFLEPQLCVFEVLLWLNRQLLPFIQNKETHELMPEVSLPFSSSFPTPLPFSVLNNQSVFSKQSTRFLLTNMVIASHTISIRIGFHKMEEVLSLGWLKHGEVPATDL